MTVIINGTDNAVGNPAIQGGTGGTSAGLYYPAANTVAITTSGVNALTISSTQAVTFANNVTITGTLTATGGIVQGANTAPAFSAYQNSGQAVANNATVTVNFDTKEFDTANCYSTSTNRFTPTVAGYYQVNVAITALYGSGETSIQLLKNGSVIKLIGDIPGAYNYVINGSALVYMNGTTDYLTVTCFVTTGLTILTGANRTYFQGFLARSA